MTDSTGAVLEYGYDSQNRRVSESRKISDTACQTFRYRYDAAGRMTELHRTADREGSGRRSVMVRYEYDRNGNMTRTILPSGAEILREYDPAKAWLRKSMWALTVGFITPPALPMTKRET